MRTKAWEESPIAILGSGNIGTAIARGLANHGGVARDKIILTRRQLGHLEDAAGEGFRVADNATALAEAGAVIVAVGPGDLDALLFEIGPDLDETRHVLVSVVSGATIADIRSGLAVNVPVARAMPNTAVALGESMTALASESEQSRALETASAIFDRVGRTLVIAEDLMTAATALCACGVAFFLRAIRAASQGGIEIGFHSEEAYLMASQTAKGAASLLLSASKHPEYEIDRVTTPRGCTIAGLNEMEHGGLSSAFIKGIIKSAVKAADLYPKKGELGADPSRREM